MESSVWLLAFERLLSNEEAAGQAFAKGSIDLTAMKQLIAAMLANSCTRFMRSRGQAANSILLERFVLSHECPLMR
ncbi:hypothetical protein HDF13_002208 [Edaphobacter lichenicola]|uniref:Uncharacterized protein n=1 Tax=Tunturiibacter gelidiferens TaxID=3069689 RepID=A0ACC5NZI6_9BACT|nr:hypothetical protein [Edaphobacter lichenicola]